MSLDDVEFWGLCLAAIGAAYGAAKLGIFTVRALPARPPRRRKRREKKVVPRVLPPVPDSEPLRDTVVYRLKCSECGFVARIRCEGIKPWPKCPRCKEYSIVAKVEYREYQ